jgi:protoheme IX farnesyltransferase
MVGTAYLAGAVLCGLGYLYYGVLTARVKTTMQARRLLQASVIYLPRIYSLLILDKVS